MQPRITPNGQLTRIKVVPGVSGGLGNRAPSRRPLNSRADPHGSDDVRVVPYPARIIVADHHDIPRAGLRGLLGGEPEFEVITEASDGRQVVALCRRLRPDLLLTEVHLGGLDGLAAARQIRHESPHTHIVVVTGHDDPALLREALEAGIAAYVLKSATRDELLDTLRQVLSGEIILDRTLAARTLHQMVEAPSWSGATLTAREQEVLRLLAHGKTNQQIGLELSVSTRTAKAHVERIIARLGVANRTEAVSRAIAMGMLTPPPAPPLR